MSRKVNFAVQSLIIAATLVVSAQSFAQSYYREINYKLVKTQNNSSRNVCVRRIFGECVQWRQEVNQRTVSNWTPHTSDKALQALRIVANNFLRPDITRCALDAARWQYTSDAPYSLPSYNDFRNYVNNQMEALRRWGFPHVTVQINKLGHPVAGRAGLGNFVEARVFDGGSSVKGRYHFQMDEAYMNHAPVNQIAGVMAHEMLHQMTHSHPKGYDDENFVVVFQNCFVNNGRYSRPGFGLHGGGGITPDRVND